MVARSADDDLRVAQLGTQLLTDRSATEPETVVDHLLAIQAQELRAARLAVRARTTGLASSDLDAAFTDRRTMVITWLNRTTLHLVPAVDHWWLHDLLTPRMKTSSGTRLRQEGVDEIDEARGVEILRGTVRDEGPKTRAELREVLDAAGVPTAGQAMVHLLLAATIPGHLVRGPMAGAEQAFAHAPTWLGERPDEDRSIQLARLAERYLRGHGPADAKDLVKWTGLALGECRSAFAAIADRTVPWGGDGKVVLADWPAPTGLPAPRLLGGYDPILHGWARRDQFVQGHQGVVSNNGLFRPTALVDGQVVATWLLPQGEVELSRLQPISKQATKALEAEAEDIKRFFSARPSDAGGALGRLGDEGGAISPEIDG